MDKSTDHYPQPRTVTLILTPDAAAAQREAAAPSPALSALSATLDAFGVDAVPDYPDSDDPFFAPYFTIEIDAETQVEALVDALLALEAVDGAYAKPAGRPPS